MRLLARVACEAVVVVVVFTHSSHGGGGGVGKIVGNFLQWSLLLLVLVVMVTGQLVLRHLVVEEQIVFNLKVERNYKQPGRERREIWLQAGLGSVKATELLIVSHHPQSQSQSQCSQKYE